MNRQCGTWLDQKLKDLQVSELYQTEKTNEEIARDYGLKVSDVCKLNYNENLFIPREKIAALIKKVADEVDIRIYPQNEEILLKEAIANYLHLTSENVTIGNSSDEVMERTIRLFLGKTERAITYSPTFSIFRYEVLYQGSKYIDVPLKDDFTIDMENMRKAFTSDARLLYLCSPNNPTSNQLKPREVEALIEDFPGIVLIDEAYAEYADYSVVPMIKKYENLVVLRTFSKAFSLAGLRIGYAVANPTLTSTLNRTPAPYLVNVISMKMANIMLENVDTMRRSVLALKKERGNLLNELSKLKGIQTFDSKANFVLFNTKKPCREIYEASLRRGLIIKKLGKLLKYENCLRTTVGLPYMNARLLEVLRENLVD